jgi:ABC-type multidrug transport system fused ATPase/permease subunit
LISLARVILKKSKILVLDEASSNLDSSTDDLFQFKIREIFCDSTIITIAHRLISIADYDRVLVL